MTTSSHHLLLVDDDSANLFTLSALLEDEGFAVHTEGSLRGALDAARRDHSYDIVLLDRHLGDGDGLTIVDTLRRDLPGARIVLMTGDELDSAMSVVDAVITKGSAFTGVLDRLRTLVPSAPVAP